MKKKGIIVLISSLIIISILIIRTFYFNDSSNNIISNIEKDTEVINSNMITMMYETEAGTGIYEETKDTTWPENGYIFNENLSGCERGGELEYNSINNTVNLLSNKSDNCYVYFDKYDGVWIDNISVTNVTGSSVTLDISATSENGSITTYYYSLNDSEYQETTSNPITINDLNKLTEYKISIYAIDSTNARSNIYEVIVTTTDESGPVINSVSVSDITSYGFTLTVDATSDVGIERYYYIIKSLNISGTSINNSYIFNELNSNTNYDITVFALDKNGLYSDEYSLNVSTDNSITLSDLVISRYNGIQGNNGIYYHSDLLSNSAGDNSYRYAGANPNNYVCFGSDEVTCPSDNLYRIIGVFDGEVKLIKWDYANSDLLGTDGTYSSYTFNANVYSNYGGNHLTINTYSWYQGGIVSDDWNRSNLNLVNLNTNFLNSLGNWINVISIHKWHINGMSYGVGIGIPALVYNIEVMRNSSGASYNAKIGIMYISDYAYAVSNNYWTRNLSAYNNITEYNWMHMGMDEWTISYSADADWPSGFYVTNYGSINESRVNSSNYAIRPCFYLNSNVEYASGSGTQSDPIRIVV